MTQFDAVSPDSIDNNDEAVHKDLLYKPKILTNIETDYSGREYSWVTGQECTILKSFKVNDLSFFFSPFVASKQVIVDKGSKEITVTQMVI